MEKRCHCCALCGFCHLWLDYQWHFLRGIHPRSDCALLSRDGGTISTARLRKLDNRGVHPSYAYSAAPTLYGCKVLCGLGHSCLSHQAQEPSFCSVLQGGVQRKGKRCEARMDRHVQPYSVLHQLKVSLLQNKISERCILVFKQTLQAYFEEY